MPGSYTSLHYHLVWSTKHRRPQITADMSERLYSFIGGIVRDEKGVLLAIGGMPDHIHLLVRWRPDLSLSNLLRDIKTRSSRWAHEALELPDFRWQDGYSGFTVSRSAIDDVRSYVERQEEHHRHRTFEEELVALLRAHGVEFDEKYVFG